MVLCIVALIVFGFLSIFSVKYRSIAKEALECTLRKITLRPCETKLDERIRAKIVAKTLKYSPRTAYFINKNFELLSLIFTAAFFISLIYTVYSIYNLITLGTCDPISGNCVFASLIDNQTNKTLPPGKSPCGLTTFIEFYGAECPHCQKMVPIVEKVEKESGVIFQKLEVWHNDTNRETMLYYAKDIERDCGFLGVPTFFSTKTNRSVCGEMTVEKLKRFILENG